MRYTFPSILHADKIGYAVHSSSYELCDMCNGKYVNAHCGQFDTYGDGMTQHSPETIVRADNMGDYCASLAKFASERPEVVKMISDEWYPHPLGRNRIVFLSNLRYNENKSQWFNKTTHKVSSVRSKQYDTRWTEVPSWADGSAGTVFALLDFGSIGLLKGFIYYSQIAQVLNEETDRYSEPALPWLGINERHLYSAIMALDSLVKSHREREEFERHFGNWERNVRPREEEKEETEAARINIRGKHFAASETAADFSVLSILKTAASRPPSRQSKKTD